MRVAMIGAGYVGLVSGACFAEFGHVVTCVDKDADRVEALRQGVIPIYEPGLSDMVASNMSGGRLCFTTGIASAVRAADVVLIAVGTPSRRGDGHADLNYVFAAAREIAAALSGLTIVVMKSTVPVGTGDDVERIIRQMRRTPMSWSCRIPSFSARAQLFRTSSIRIASSSEPMTRARER